MLNRVERVARVKGVEYEVERSFARKEDYREQKDKKKFSQVLQNVMKRNENQSSSEIPAPYALDIKSRATQSLFYQNGADFRYLGDRLNGAG